MLRTFGISPAAAALIAFSLLLAGISPAEAWCQYFQISGVANGVPPTLTDQPGTPNSPAVLDYTPPYTPAATSWNFGTVLPSNTSAYVTGIYLQDKYVNYFPRPLTIPPTPLPLTPFGTRSSYLVVPGLWTATSHQPGGFQSPLLVPPGFTFSGRLFNHSPEDQNMIGLITGYAFDSEECRSKFR